MIRAADDRCLSEARELYTISPNVADRLRKYNGIEPDGILYPPLLDPEQFSCGEAGDYVFYPSRLCFFKRQHVAIEAMRFVRSDFRLVIAGKPDTETYQRRAGGPDPPPPARGPGAVAGPGLRSGEGPAAGPRLRGPLHPHRRGLRVRHAGGLPLRQAGADLHATRGASSISSSTGTTGWSWSRRPSAGRGTGAALGRPARARDMGRAARETLGRKRIDWDHVLDTLLS